VESAGVAAEHRRVERHRDTIDLALHTLTIAWVCWAMTAGGWPGEPSTPVVLAM